MPSLRYSTVPLHRIVYTANRTVTQMWLYANNLQGEVPLLLADLVSLRSLSLGANRLTGAIPTTIWANMSQLRYLSLAKNLLVGEIPASLGELGTLTELRLHGNSLEGVVPTQLGELMMLQVWQTPPLTWWTIVLSRTSL